MKDDEARQDAVPTPPTPPPRFSGDHRSAPANHRRSDKRLLLDGRPGREGFLFHDAFSAVHQGAPGLLGLVEARAAMELWRPGIIQWLDGTEHFFNHLILEFQDELCFEPVRRRMQEIRERWSTWETRNRLLFSYLSMATRQLELSDLLGSHRRRHVHRIRSTTELDAITLGGSWSVHYRVGHGRYADRDITIPINWELVPGIDNYSGSMRFTKLVRIAADIRDQCLRLRLHGVDYFANIWINGTHVAGHEGYFAPIDVDISEWWRQSQDNVVRVLVTSPNDPTCDGTDFSSGWGHFAPGSFPNSKTLVKGTLGHHDARRGGAWSCLTSQDGNTGGIWNEAELRVLAPVHFGVHGIRITTLSMWPVSTGEGSVVGVLITATVHNRSETAARANVRFEIEPANFEGVTVRLSRQIALAPGENQVGITANLAPVSPWSPRDHGPPHLYTVTSLLLIDGEVVDRSVTDTGFRMLAVSPIGESEGRDGALVVNGQRVFVRGTNLLPTYWLSEYTDDRIDHDFELLAGAGFNAVLVHNLVAPRRFYEQADRRGFLVVQMFPLQWSYDSSAEFTARASAQLDDMVALLTNHPSLVSYETHNEPDMRTSQGVDNRHLDIDLHARLRRADPHRWATTFASGNHAYPGQFYPLRDDNGFATLPGRFEQREFDGHRIARHANLPTEFGLQAMPHLDLFRELMSEARVRDVLRRIRDDPRWLSAGGEVWVETARALHDITAVLGGGSWTAALRALDWTTLWDPGALARRLEALPPPSRHRDGRVVVTHHEHERLMVRLGLLLLEVLHYGGFKDENFWFGLWRPASTLEGFVASSQRRQYRLHKEAVETYLNAGVMGPITGYFSFMLRDADWQAPTWGVVDAAWIPKEAYRAYVESNQPVRVTLPRALTGSVKLPGDPWLTSPRVVREGVEEPWERPEMIVANDTSDSLAGAIVTVWLEDDDGRPLPFVDRGGHQGDAYRLVLNLPAHGAWTATGGLPLVGGTSPSEWVVAGVNAGARLRLRARVSSAEGQTLSTNGYEIYIPDTELRDLDRLDLGEVNRLVQGAPGRSGFVFWGHARPPHHARPGVRGLLEGFREAEARGIDVYEVVQGEHLFRHLLEELGELEGAERLCEEVWRIRSEMISPSRKADLLLRYLEIFVRRAEDRLAGRRRTRSHQPTAARRSASTDRTGQGLDAPACRRSPGSAAARIAAAGRDRTADRPQRPRGGVDPGRG